MLKIPNDPTATSRFKVFKEELPLILEVSGSVPLYKRPLIPFVIISGCISELIAAAGQGRIEKKFIAAIKEKYDVEEVKVHARGCTTDVKNVYRRQISVMQVRGVDYAFTLEFDKNTNEPILTPGPYISDSMPYQPCPLNPIDLLK